MSTQGWRQNELDASLWQAMFYTKYTTVRTAIITPILVAFMFVVSALAHVLLNSVAAVHVCHGFQQLCASIH
jgi:hypothetical protein